MYVRSIIVIFLLCVYKFGNVIQQIIHRDIRYSSILNFTNKLSIHYMIGLFDGEPAKAHKYRFDSYQF
jgi:hypothetical protein